MPDGTVTLELLAALEPRPRINLVLYYGLLAPRATGPPVRSTTCTSTRIASAALRDTGRCPCASANVDAAANAAKAARQADGRVPRMRCAFNVQG